MTQPTHDEVIAWIDDHLENLEIALTPPNPDGLSIFHFLRASLLANRAGLEMHKPKEHCKNPNCTGPVCSECGSKETVQIALPCPTYTDIAEPIRSVM